MPDTCPRPDKVAHRTERVAEMARRDMVRSTGHESLEVYRCSCGNWHVGHSNELTPRPCGWCEEQFAPTSPRQRYCCRAHKIKAQKRRQQRARRGLAPAPVVGRSVWPAQPTEG